jgi:hypothetical protein
MVSPGMLGVVVWLGIGLIALLWPGVFARLAR